MNRYLSPALRSNPRVSRQYAAIAAMIVGLCGTGIARADLVTTTGIATGSGIIQPGGPRNSSGLTYFNMEGDSNGSNASYGVVDFNTTSFLSYGVTNVSSLTLSFTEANSSFTAPGSVEVYLASDSSATILTGAGNYTVPPYVSGVTPEGIGPNPTLLNSTVPAFGTLTDLGSIAFNTTGNVNNGSVDSLSLSSLSPAMSAFLANDLNANGTVRFVLTPNTPTTAATWAGVAYNTVSYRPTLALTYTGSTITYVTLLWTGTGSTWDTAATSWQTTSSTYTPWSNPGGSVTTAVFNTNKPLGIDAGGINVRALTFLTGTDGMILNGPGKVTLFQGNISVASSSHVTIAAPLSGSVGVNVTGGGYLTLTNIANDFTGSVTLNGSTLYVNDTGMATLGNPNNPITLNRGSLVLTAAQTVISRNLLVEGPSTLDTGTSSGLISFQAYLTNGGSGTLTRLGTGVLSFDLSDASPPGYFNSGTLIIAAGTVRLTNAAGGYTALGSGTAVVNSGATLSFADINGGGGLNVRNAPNITLNAGGILTATGGINTLSSNTIKISTLAGAPAVINSGLLGDNLVINSALRDSATGGSAAVLNVVGAGILQMASGAVSAASKPSSPAFSGTWNVSLDPAGILTFGPVNVGGLGEVLNSPGYPAPAVNSTANNYSGVTNPITINSGTVAFGADVANPNNTTSTLTIVSFRSPLTLNGGSIASTSYEYDTAGAYAPPNSGPGNPNFDPTAPVIANLGADITMAANKTSTVLLYDPVAGPAAGGRSLNIMTDPNAVSTSGAPVSTNLTWGANSLLVVDATGVSAPFGALNFTRTSGTVTVGAGATLQINPNAVVNLGGNQDALNDGTHQVAVVDNGLLQVTGGNKNIGAVTGSGILQVNSSTTLTSDGVNLPAGSLTIAGNQQIRANGSAQGVSKVSALVLTTGTLDLTNNLLVVETTGGANKTATYTTLQNEMASGALTSSTITSTTALALVDNGALSTPKTSMLGTTVDSNSLLVVQALKGDANLDGVVNLADLTLELQYYNMPQSTKTWNEGNFGGASALADLTSLLQDYNHTFGNFSSAAVLGGTGLAGSTLSGTGLGGTSAVPEPASLMLLGLGSVVILSRRQRRRS